MKYFIDAKSRTASGHENYIEFQVPNHKEEFWDDDSLYMSEAALNETGFRKFWTDCMFNDIVFDLDTVALEIKGRCNCKSYKSDDAMWCRSKWVDILKKPG